MARPRNSIAELERMLRVVEPGTNILGQYLAEASEELAPRLGIDAAKLMALMTLPDETIAPMLAQFLEHRAAERAAAHQAEVRVAVMSAARRLGVTAVWTNDVVALDVGLLLGELLLDTSKSYILFDAHGLCVEFQVSLPRSLLVNVARELGRRPDLLAGLDEEGLHFRWNGGRGGLNFLSRSIPANEAMNVLYVNIPRPVVRAHRVAARGGWFADVLSEVALASVTPTPALGRSRVRAVLLPERQRDSARARARLPPPSRGAVRA